jgi:hypothetical protein
VCLFVHTNTCTEEVHKLCSIPVKSGDNVNKVPFHYARTLSTDYVTRQNPQEQVPGLGHSGVSSVNTMIVEMHLKEMGSYHFLTLSLTWCHFILLLIFSPKNVIEII